MSADVLINKKGKNKYVVTRIYTERAPANDDIRTWCTEMFGPGGRNSKCRWRFGWTSNSDTYHFKCAEDATMFMLRWG
jgi:hypothetical protein